MAKQFSQLVWLGANTASEPIDVLNTAAHATLFEAREVACKALQQKFPQNNVTVIQTVLTTNNLNTSFTEYNLAEFSAIRPATGLKVLFPGLKATNNEQLLGTAINDAISALQLNDSKNLLIVDISDSSLALLNTIEEYNQLSHFSSIYIQTSNEPLYDGAPTSTEITNFLEAKGYMVQQKVGEDPDLPWIIFIRNPLWEALKKTQRDLKHEQHEKKLLSEELSKAKENLALQQDTNEALKKNIEKIKQDWSLEKKQREENANTHEITWKNAATKEIEKLKLDFEQMSKTAANRKDFVLRLEKENLNLSEKNLRLEKKQIALEQEVVKADAQITLIKELFLKQ